MFGFLQIARKGAFWEDRYHATAIESGKHLMRCMIYIDLNMVRASIVKHPFEWTMNSYSEIQNPPDRYSLIDTKGLMELYGLINKEQLRSEYRQWFKAPLMTVVVVESLARQKVLRWGVASL